METQSSAPAEAQEASNYLCLQCRGVGHLMENCMNPWYEDHFVFSDVRRGMKFEEFPDSVSEQLCSRCKDLNLIELLYRELPWKSLMALSDEKVRESGCLRSIGTTGSVVFRQDCPLCRCLFALTPEPDNDFQEVMLFPSWTMCRLEGGISIDTPEKERYTRCLLVTLDPLRGRLGMVHNSGTGDALCLLQEDSPDPDTTLGGRLIDPHRIDLDMIQTWLSTCSKLHPITCKSIWTEDLRTIQLIDVDSRQIVPFPQIACRYLCLSYVWGGVAQESRALGTTLKVVPQTIEDAISFTKRLGRQYLWVDSICIEQENEVEKLRQIRIMSAIYEGADATIIAVSGKSATAGIPRMRPDCAMFPQLKCRIDGKRLVGLMPTLSQYIFSSAWGDRAWTLQEALLSRRCIYMSDHQVYFECNAMQCSESLDESRSWVHQTFRDAEFVRNGHSEGVIGAGVLRSPFVGSEHTNDRLQQYTVLANLYSFRNMSFPADAINGFSGIIQYLTRLEYQEGFFCGMPVEDLNWALAWSVRSPMKRRPGFPSWSWAGWSCSLSETTPIDIRNPHRYPVYLKCWKLQSEQLLPLLSLPKPVGELNDKVGVQVLPEGHTLRNVMESEYKGEDFDLEALLMLDTDSMLFVEGIFFEFVPQYNQPRLKSRSYGEFEYFDMEVAGVTCLVQIMSVDAVISDEGPQNSLKCLLLARDVDAWKDDCYHLLVLNEEGSLVSRRTMITLMTSEDSTDILDVMKLTKQRVVLQ